MSTQLAAAETEAFVATTIQAGNKPKNSGTLTIDFPVPFARIPIVVISPVSPIGIAFPETISAVSMDQFTLSSGNAAPDYSVNWIAYVA